jgi:hypothetical protein
VTPLTPSHWRVIAGGGIVALVVAACASGDTGGSVVSLSPSSSAQTSVVPSPDSPIEASIATGNGPITLAATSESIWVELHREDTVARIDPVTNQQVQVTSVPSHCFIAASGESVWATIAKGNQVTRFAAATGEAVESWNVPSACGLALDGDTAWVTSPGNAAVYVLQEGVAEPIQRIEVAPDIFDIALDEASAWVQSESQGGSLWRIDRATGQATLVEKYPGLDAIEIAFGSVWLSSRALGHLWKVNPADGSLLGQLDLLEPSGVAAAGDALWVTQLGGGLVEVDPDTLEVVSEEQLFYPYFSPPIYAFGSLWVSSLETNEVLRIHVGD